MTAALRLAAGATLLAAMTAASGVCEWQGGRDRFTGLTSAAVLRDTTIPLPERLLLAAKVARHDFADRVEITRDAIVGGFDYAPQISRMTFGAGRVCETVTRARWSDDETQGALVYVVGGYAVGVAAVCGNVFRLRLKAPAAAAPAVPVPPAWAVPRLAERARTVDEPPSLWLVLLAGAVAGIYRRGRAPRTPWSLPTQQPSPPVSGTGLAGALLPGGAPQSERAA